MPYKIEKFSDMSYIKQYKDERLLCNREWQMPVYQSAKTCGFRNWIYTGEDEIGGTL